VSFSALSGRVQAQKRLKNFAPPVDAAAARFSSCRDAKPAMSQIPIQIMPMNAKPQYLRAVKIKKINIPVAR
jgi:hypothetical protein